MQLLGEILWLFLKIRNVSVSILMDFQNNLGRCCIDVIFSIQRCSLWIFIALIGGRPVHGRAATHGKRLEGWFILFCIQCVSLDY